jgi:transcriptional regulator with XRE-family HTH domain
MKFNKVSQDYKQLNMFIREEMRIKKISQESLAYSLNITQKSISNKLSGKTDWTVWEILNAFDVLGIDFDYKEKL